MAKPALAMALVLAGSAWATPASELAVSHAWARATPPGSTVGGAYLTIDNHGATPARLIAVSSSVASEAAVHVTQIAGGVAGMHETPLVVPAHGSVKLNPGGMHLMLMGLKAPLVQGSHFELRMNFEPGGVVTVSVPVLAPDSAGP